MKMHWAVHCDTCTLIMCYTGAKSPNENEIKWVFLKKVNIKIIMMCKQESKME